MVNKGKGTSKYLCLSEAMHSTIIPLNEVKSLATYINDKLLGNYLNIQLHQATLALEMYLSRSFQIGLCSGTY